jgi:hypothetical protein
LPFGGRAVRADIVEVVYAGATADPPVPEERLATRLGCPRREVARIVEAILEDR